MSGEMFKEDKAEFCKALCDLLRMTSCAGDDRYNSLAELRYIRLGNGDEIVRPIFQDGTGEDGYYDVNVSGDSCMGILSDVMKQFVRKMW